MRWERTTARVGALAALLVLAASEAQAASTKPAHSDPGASSEHGAAKTDHRAAPGAKDDSSHQVAAKDAAHDGGAKKGGQRAPLEAHLAHKSADGDTGSTAQEVQSAASVLSKQSEPARFKVDNFLAQVRAA